MIFKERWDLAYNSELTPLGRLSIIILSILFVVFGIMFSISMLTGIEGIEGMEGGGSLVIGSLMFILVVGLGILFLGTFSFFIAAIVEWIRTGEYYFWDGAGFLIESIITAYKLLFGDYNGKFDFLDKEEKWKKE